MSASPLSTTSAGSVLTVTEGTRIVETFESCFGEVSIVFEQSLRKAGLGQKGSKEWRHPLEENVTLISPGTKCVPRGW